MVATEVIAAEVVTALAPAPLPTAVALPVNVALSVNVAVVVNVAVAVTVAMAVNVAVAMAVNVAVAVAFFFSRSSRFIYSFYNSRCWYNTVSVEKYCSSFH